MTTIWAKQALTSSGWQNDVAVTLDTSGRIANVIADSPAIGQQVEILLPAPANAHSHAFQRAMAGLTEKRGPDARDSFWTWRQLMYRFLDHLGPDQVQAIAAYTQMEMLEAGYGCNVEFHYLHHRVDGLPYDNIAEMSDRIMAAASQSGIGLTLLPVHYQYGGCDKRELGAGQRRFGNDGARYHALFDAAFKGLGALPADSVIGVAPHSLRAVAPEDLPNTIALAGTGPVHLHLVEQPAEVAEIQAAWGARPVEWLLENAQVNGQWCLIHCTQMLQHETLGLAATGAVAGLCPITESSLGDGIFDGVRWMDAGGKIAIGSDSNIRISLTEELRTLDYSQRLRDHSRAALASAEQSTGRRLFQAVAAGGAQAAGRGGAGAIKVGEWGDLCALDGTHIDLLGLAGDQVLDAFIFASDDRRVRDVWSAGRHMVKAGRHVNRTAIAATYRKTILGLRGAL